MNIIGRHQKENEHMFTCKKYCEKTFRLKILSFVSLFNFFHVYKAVVVMPCHVKSVCNFLPKWHGTLVLVYFALSTSDTVYFKLSRVSLPVVTFDSNVWQITQFYEKNSIVELFDVCLGTSFVETAATQRYTGKGSGNMVEKLKISWLIKEYACLNFARNW